MNTGDTIIAPASGHARASRALLRLSGPDLPALLADPRLLADPIDLPALPRPEIRRAVLRLQPDGSPLPCLVLLYPSPRSYTGEHCAELLIPGNPLLMERVIATILSFSGVRAATPGEFSARAYLAGKMTLAQAEGIAATIAARTDAELAAAESLLSGETGRCYQRWADELTDLLALVEAGIDFTDQEDVVPIAPEALVRRLGELAHEIASHLGSSRGSEHSEALPVVALAGAPNAGKSTLFNALLGRRRAVVSPVPGTTRDVLAERLDLSADAPGAEPVMLLDLAGLDADAAGGIDRQAQSRARGALAHADVVIHCDPFGRFDTPIPGSASRPTIRVRTKSDVPSPRRADASATRHLPICALDGWNLGPLRRAIADAALAAGPGGDEHAALVPRHRRAMTVTVDHLRAALAHVQPHRHEHALASPELVGGSLRAALDALAELTGQVTPDDVIGRVFATFCVGK